MFKKIIIGIVAMTVAVLAAYAFSLNSTSASEKRMLRALKEAQTNAYNYKNRFCPQATLEYMDSVLANPSNPAEDQSMNYYTKGNLLMMVGMPEEAVEVFESLLNTLPASKTAVRNSITEDLAVAYLRVGEQTNCILSHSTDACVMPIRDGGIHRNPRGSRGSIDIYTKILAKNPKNMEARWLLNIAYMTLGEYPNQVPKEFLLPNLDKPSAVPIQPFEDIAPDLGLDINNMAGGVIIEDFDNDGNLDIVMSGWGIDEPMHYFKNNGDGTFTDRSEASRLKLFTGGLHIMQTDYDNDGYKDIFVPRGAWLTGANTEQPISLLRNNQDGTFTDVTVKSGLFSVGHSQTATWNDFNNDGWLDVFVGNETTGGKNFKPCQLFLNNKNGTFTDRAKETNCYGMAFVKGVNSGDFNNDGWQDIIISTLGDGQLLPQNFGNIGKDGFIQFKDITNQSGLGRESSRSFSTWFWDFDNDGWLDIIVNDYSFKTSLAYYAAAENLGESPEQHGQPMLYKNNGDGTFKNITKEMGLDATCFAMGSNFGDIDNDGYLDFFLGTGNPDYKSLVPNKMFKNMEGKGFADVTTAAKVGNLQKGHGVAFGDLDNDGDQDIYIEMGGAYIGDAYRNSFFRNPGQNDNNWLYLNLEGTKANKAAIGTRIKLTFKENGVERSIYREVNSGSSFGASTLKREIGVGQATVIDEIEIKWQGSGTVQRFKNVKVNQNLKLIEGKDVPVLIPLKQFVFKNKKHQEIPMCVPQKTI